MVKKISGRGQSAGGGRKSKPLQGKRLKLKRLHQDVAKDRTALRGTEPDDLPPASSSNAARQARSKLDITFPVSWQERHLGNPSDDELDDESKEDGAK